MKILNLTKDGKLRIHKDRKGGEKRNREKKSRKKEREINDQRKRMS